MSMSVTAPRGLVDSSLGCSTPPTATPTPSLVRAPVVQTELAKMIADSIPGRSLSGLASLVDRPVSVPRFLAEVLARPYPLRRSSRDYSRDYKSRRFPEIGGERSEQTCRSQAISVNGDERREPPDHFPKPCVAGSNPAVGARNARSKPYDPLADRRGG